MDVHVDETGAHHHPTGVNHLGVRLPDITADDGDFPVLDQNVHHSADTPYGVNQLSLADQQLQNTTPFRVRRVSFPACAHQKRDQVFPAPLLPNLCASGHSDNRGKHIFPYFSVRLSPSGGNCPDRDIIALNHII